MKTDFVLVFIALFVVLFASEMKVDEEEPIGFGDKFSPHFYDPIALKW